MLSTLFPTVPPAETGAAALMRGIDWGATPLGPPDGWPQPLKTLVELMLAANQPMFVAWGPENILLYNDPYAALLGRKHPAAMGRPFLQVWKEAVADLRPLVERVLAGEPVHSDDITLFLDREGRGLEEAHFQFSYTPVRDEAGAVGGFFCACVETTAQVTAERERGAVLAALAESEGNYRHAVELSPQTIWTARPDGRLDHVGQRWEEWTGKDGRGAGWGEALHPDDLPPSVEAWTRSVSTGAPYDIEHRVRMRDGSFRWMHSRAYPARGDDGAILRWYGTTEDVDDAKRAEEAERESRERLRLVVDNATDYAIITTDRERRVTSWSAGAENVFGWTADEMLGESADRIFTPEDRTTGQPEKEVGEALATGCANDERWHQRRDGSRVYMSGSARALPPGPDGEPLGVMKIARDQTDQRRAADAVAESEARFRNMADGAPVMMWVTDAEGYCTYLNRRWYEYTGQTSEEAEGFGWLDTTHPDDKATAEAAFVEANAARAPFRIEYRLRRADGAYRWAIDAASPRFDADGTYLGYVGSVIDIDERREVELALRESERRLQTALEVAAVGTFAWEVDTGRIEVDARSREIFGLPETGPVMVEAMFAHVVPEDLERVRAEASAAVEARTRLDIEYDIIHPDGGRRSVVSLSDIAGRNDPNPRMSGALIDVTEQRAARRALEDVNATLERLVEERSAALRLYENIVQSDAAPVVAFDPELRITAFNKAHGEEWLRVFGRPARVDERLPDQLPPDQAAIVRDFMERALAGEAFVVREALGDPDLAKPYWEIAYNPLRDEAGEIIGAFHHAVDISAELRAEAELAQAQDALRQAQKMEAVGQLTGGIAHDFNNLLTGIVGSLELMQRRVGEGRYDALEKYANVAMTSAQRAAALTQRLLAFSRRQPLSPKTVEGNKLVASMEDLLRRTLGPQIDLEMVLAGGLWPTLCDPNQLESAILNLAINARDAMDEGGRLTIETSNAHLDAAYARAHAGEVEPGQYVAICVTDTGTGIPPDVMARVFEPFFTTKPLGQGTGLGLSQLYGFVKQSGGHVAVYSEPGQGTTFKLYLPRHGGRMDAAEPEAGGAEPVRAADGETVLVVEDEAAVRMLISETLDELGYRAVEAVDGPGGLRELQSDRRIDLLVTDVGLPGLNGRQLADAARELRPELKVLFITGFAGNAAVGNGLLEPGMEMMTKPFAMDALAAKISGMIEG